MIQNIKIIYPLNGAEQGHEEISVVVGELAL